MRTLTISCLALALALQVGCASIPRMTAFRKPKSNPKVAEQYLTARQMEGQGKLEQAREIYKGLLDKNPKNPDYLHRLAVVCTRLQRYGDATSYYERARRHDPKNASILTDMGYSSYLRGNHNDAERLLRDALHLKPSDKRATSNLALVVGKQGRTNEALDLLKKVGDESTALAALGYIHSERGEFALAEQRYQEALNLDPNLKEAKVALAQLAKQHPADSIVAESKPTDFDVRDFEDSANPVVKTTEIQQVSALAETATPLITTASFTEEWSEPSEPARLDEEQQQVAGRVTLFDEPTSLSEDETSDEETRFPISTAQPADESWDDDWSHDESAKTNSAKESASEWDDNVKTNSDDEWPEYQEESSLTSSEAPLAFGPRRKPARNVASELLMESDGDFSAPSISKNRSK